RQAVVRQLHGRRILRLRARARRADGQRDRLRHAASDDGECHLLIHREAERHGVEGMAGVHGDAVHGSDDVALHEPGDRRRPTRPMTTPAPLTRGAPSFRGSAVASTESTLLTCGSPSGRLSVRPVPLTVPVLRVSAPGGAWATAIARSPTVAVVPANASAVRF